jgi:hypothetical protein
VGVQCALARANNRHQGSFWRTMIRDSATIAFYEPIHLQDARSNKLL